MKTLAICGLLVLVLLPARGDTINDQRAALVKIFHYVESVGVPRNGVLCVGDLIDGAVVSVCTLREEGADMLGITHEIDVIVGGRSVDVCTATFVVAMPRGILLPDSLLCPPKYQTTFTNAPEMVGNLFAETLQHVSKWVERKQPST